MKTDIETPSRSEAILDVKKQAARRELWFRTARERIDEVLNRDGSGKIPQFDPPYREPVWILPALYHGPQESIDLANRIVERYHDDPSTRRWKKHSVSGAEYNIFQTNCFSELYYDFRHLLTPGAEKVMRWHAEMAGRTFAGSAAPDFVFRGCNDNMPAHATCGLLAAGQALGDEGMIKHARWNLRQLRQALSRTAWMGEFNSSTYSGGTLTYMSKIATIAQDMEIRTLALEIERRIWAEVLLHYHPGTFRQAGPQARAYSIDYAGDSHNLQFTLWYAFGPEITGRDVYARYFHPDGRGVTHFAGCHWQTIAECCHCADTELHVPHDLAWLIAGRKYPAVLRGRAEVNHAFDRFGGQVQTETYMREAFSLGSCNNLCLGCAQTASLYATYRLKRDVETYRDAASVFYKYRVDDEPLGQLETSDDGGSKGEKYLHQQGWCYTSQKENVAVLLCTPNPMKALDTTSMKMNLMFPAHFSSIKASIIGDGPRREGATGESTEVVPVSVEAGEVYIHIHPLLPTNLPRRAAVRFSRQNAHEVLELVNYEGAARHFEPIELGRVLNGFVITIDEARNHRSLEAFHHRKSAARIVDYLFVGMRYFEYLRDDVWFRIAMTPATPVAMIDMIDGLTRPMPVFESNQIDPGALPYLNERNEPNFEFFPWENMEMRDWANSWIIGSRGLPGEEPYSRRAEALYPAPDGARQ